MSSDDSRRIEGPNSGADGGDVDPAWKVGEDPLWAPGPSGGEAEQGLADPARQSRTDESTAAAPSHGLESGPYAATRVVEGASNDAMGTEAALPIADDALAKERSRKGWIIGGSVAAAVVLVAVIAAVAVSANSVPSEQAAPTPSRSTPVRNLVPVPDLVGMTVAEARSTLNGIGLPLAVPDGTDDESIVATQTPSSGEEVAIATEVVATVEERAEAAADSLSFVDGAALKPLTAVGWKFSFADDTSWTPSPDAGEGEVIFVNDKHTCTAQYWQQIFDTNATDDLAASDEYLAKTSGATADEMAQYAYDSHFALSGGLTGPAREGNVATRTLLFSTDESNVILTARVFQKLDYATSTMRNAYLLQLKCDLDVDPQDIVDSLDDVAKVSVGQ